MRLSNVFCVDTRFFVSILDGMKPSHKVIEKFGGVDRLAELLDHKHRTTVQGWRDRGHIHPRNHKRLFALAEQEGVDLLPEDFIDYGECA